MESVKSKMSLATSIHDIKTLVLSFHPVVVIETVEEDRVVSLLRATASQLDLPFYEWSVTRGLMRYPGSTSLYGSGDPLILLKSLEELNDALFLLKDFGKFLDNPEVARGFREVSQRFSKKRSTVVVTGETVTIPREMEHSVLRPSITHTRGTTGRRQCGDALSRTSQGCAGKSELRATRGYIGRPDRADAESGPTDDCLCCAEGW